MPEPAPATAPGTGPALRPLLPPRPRLRPGLPVLRREPGTLQVGLEQPLRLLLPEHPDVGRLLAALTSGSLRVDAPLSPAATRALVALCDAGMVVEGDVGGETPEALATLAWHGPEGAERVRRRHGALVVLDVPQALEARLESLLTGYGCRVALADDDEPTSPAAATLVVRDGVVPREVLDPLMRRGTPHVTVSSGPGAVEVGPFVVPGRTACLRCVDAHAAQDDPRRAMLVSLAARGSGARGEAPAVDPALRSVALGWAVRDLVSHLEGDRPATWSATVRVDPRLVPRVRRWARHPHCGCAWGDSVTRGEDGPVTGGEVD